MNRQQEVLAEYQREIHIQYRDEIKRYRGKIELLENQIQEAEQILGMLESFENWDIVSRTAPNTYPFDKTGIYSRFKEYTEKYK